MRAHFGVAAALHEAAQRRKLGNQLLVRGGRGLGFGHTRDRRLHLLDAKHLAPYWHRHPAGSAICCTGAALNVGFTVAAACTSASAT